MRTLLSRFTLCALLALGATPTWAGGDEQTINTLPSTNTAFFTTLQNFLKREDADRFAQMFRGFVYTGGTHGTGAGLVGTPDALIAYPSGHYTTENHSITYSNDTTCWVILHKLQAGNLGSYVRVAGSHYLLNCGSATLPTLPADSLALMRVTTSGGAITAVADLRIRSAVVEPWVSVDTFGATGNGVVDAYQAFVDADAATTGPISCGPGTYLISSNLTLTSPLMFLGCVLKPASGVQITLSGGVSADTGTQIFDTTASATSYTTIQTQTVSPNWWGVKSAGSTDSLAAWNQVVKHLNGNKVEDVLFPPGKPEFSAEPDAITAGPCTIRGAGGAATIFVMQSGAGTAGTFFTLGDATHSVGRGTLRDFSFQYDNFATLDGTKKAIHLVQTADVGVTGAYVGKDGGNGAGGFIQLGSNALNTYASRTFMDNAWVLMYGPAEGTAIDVQRSNGMRFGRVTVTVGAASVTGALKCIHLHPTGGAETIDSGHWGNVECNFPGDNVNTILDIDATQGIIINQWFNAGFVADHSIQAAIKIHIDSGAHASARTNNIYFTGIRSYVDGGGSVLIDNTGDRDISNLAFSGGVLTGHDVAAIRTIGTTARIDLGVSDVNFVDEEHVTSKAVIDAQGLYALRIIGNSVGPQFTTQTPKYSYLVNFTGDVEDFVITDNDCRKCVSGVIESTLLGLNNAEKRIVKNNNGPSLEFVQRVSTTDATTTTLMNIALLDARVCNITLVIAGVKSDGTDRASYELEGTFYRTAAGNATQVSTTTMVHEKESNAAWNALFAVTGSTVQGRVTGVAATTIKWGGNVKDFVCLRE